MKLGLVLLDWTGSMNGETPSSRDVVDQARRAEAVGFDSVWLTDHVYFAYSDFECFGIEFPEALRDQRGGAWETWALVSALAVATESVRIGTLVSNTGFRNPGLFARTAATVDDLSGGRLVLGLGAGDFEVEQRSFGYALDHRISRFEEALQIITPLLRGEQVTFKGDYYNVDGAELLPPAARRQGPPILVGSLKGLPRMSRLVTQYADYWSGLLAFSASTVEAYRAAWDKMEAACHKHGRDVATLKRNVTVGVNLSGGDYLFPGTEPIAGTVDQVAERLAGFAGEGIEDCTVIAHPFTPAGIDSLGRVIEAIA